MVVYSQNDYVGNTGHEMVNSTASTKTKAFVSAGMTEGMLQRLLLSN